ncbi:MAG: methyltransferase domain-containing protein [bacterium]
MRRGNLFDEASQRAKERGVPLLVVGAPDHGPTGGYGCGDMTVDIESASTCPKFYQVDISKTKIPVADNSCVVFCSCVLEYVEDYEAAMRELQRVSGGDLYLVSVEPWTLTAFFYPGAKRTVGIDGKCTRVHSQ